MCGVGSVRAVLLCGVVRKKSKRKPCKFFNEAKLPCTAEANKRKLGMDASLFQRPE